MVKVKRCVHGVPQDATHICNKCVLVDKCDECKKRPAILICLECDSKFCEKCREEYDECPNCEPPYLVKIKESK
jgi:hypothetical protein